VILSRRRLVLDRADPVQEFSQWIGVLRGDGEVEILAVDDLQ
jgi:hypothetical protein